jgi:hypothetical protein
VFQDKLAVARLMTIELKARLVLQQRLEKRFPLDELKGGDIPTAKIQEIESVIDEVHASFAIGRHLRPGEAGQTGLVDAAEFAVDVGGFHRHLGQRRDDARIFAGPVEASSGEQLNPTIVDARRHAESVQFDFVHPLRP